MSAFYDLVRTGVECLSNDTLLAEVLTPAGCARRCKSTPGCEFFIHGFGAKAGRCYQEYTASETCIEGWEDDLYDFYKLNDSPADTPELLDGGSTLFPSPELDTHFSYDIQLTSTSASVDASFHRIKAGYECDDGANTKLHNVDTPQECANSCATSGNCTFFLFGFNTKRKQCWVEWTQSADCPEGWEKDDFDFYMLLPAVPRAPPSPPSPPASPPAPPALPPMPPPVYPSMEHGTGFIAGMLAGSGFMMAVTLLLMIPLLTILAKLLRSRRQKQPRPCPPPAHVKLVPPARRYAHVP